MVFFLKNFLDNNREPRFMKQWSSKQKSLNETLKSCSEKQFSNTEPSSSKRNIECNMLLLLNVFLFLV